MCRRRSPNRKPAHDGVPPAARNSRGAHRRAPSSGARSAGAGGGACPGPAYRVPGVRRMEHRGVPRTSADHYGVLSPSTRRCCAHLPSGQDGPTTYRLDPVGALLFWLMEPPSRIATKTPEHLAPRREDLVEGLADRFSSSQNRLREFVGGCHGLRLTRATFVSPFNASVRYSAYAALCILAVHQRRHLWQARRVREQSSSA
jgi:hypothetical protein